MVFCKFICLPLNLSGWSHCATSKTSTLVKFHLRTAPDLREDVDKWKRMQRRVSEMLKNLAGQPALRKGWRRAAAGEGRDKTKLEEAEQQREGKERKNEIS